MAIAIEPAQRSAKRRADQMTALEWSRYAQNRAISKIWRNEDVAVVTLEPHTISDAYAPERAAFAPQLIDIDDLRGHLDRDVDLSADFLNLAEASGDFCVGFFDGERLVAYGWYAAARTAWNDNVDVVFEDRWLYMYKGFTDPEYRGHKLHGFGMAEASRRAVDLGKQGLISGVSTANHRSLRSCANVGYARVGRTIAIEAFGRWRCWSSAGARRAGMRLAPRIAASV